MAIGDFDNSNIILLSCHLAIQLPKRHVIGCKSHSSDRRHVVHATLNKPYRPSLTDVMIGTVLELKLHYFHLVIKKYFYSVGVELSN